MGATPGAIGASGLLDDVVERRNPELPAKPCAVCGRTMTWRKAWARSWESVRYCSDACRRRGITAVDRDLEAALVSLLAARAASATVCPSEAARLVSSAHGGEGEAWRDLMEPARMAARRLVAAGQAEITQGGRVVDPSTARGPVRVRRAGPAVAGRERPA